MFGLVTKRAVKLSSSLARQQNWQAERLDAIGTRKIFDEDHDMFREQARKFFRSIPKERRTKWEQDKMADAEIWKEAGAAGLLGIDTPAEYGGIGADFLHCLVAEEEQAYAGPDFFGPGFGLHTNIVMPYLFNYGTEEQKQRYLPEMTSGECISCIGMTEPSAGSDLQGIKTVAKRDGDDWIINGSKTFISNGFLSTLAVVVARTDMDKKAAHGTSLFLVDVRDNPGFIKGKVLNKVGQHTYDTAELFFDNVRVPSSSILGGAKFLNKGFYCLMDELPRERLLIADQALCHLENAFELTREYTKERKAFGGSLSRMQTIRHKMADIKTDIVTCRLLVDESTEMFMDGTLDNETASMVKLVCTEKLNEHSSNLLQLFGGWGYMWEYDIGRIWAGGRVMSIYGGTSQIMKELISRSIY